MSNPDFYRAQAPADMKEGSWFVIDLKTAKVLLEEPPVGLSHDDFKKGDEGYFNPSTGILAKKLEDTFPKDLVNHPAHYNKGRIEVIEFIEDQKLGYHLGNAVKYISRAGHKDPSKEIEDLKKARWYLDRHIEMVEALSKGRAPVRPNDMVRSK